MASPASVFAEHAARGELAYQVDSDGRAVWPPQVRFSEWRVSAGERTVYTTTMVRRRGEDPHNVALIDLDEGFRMMSRVDAGEVTVGMRVRVRFEDGVAVFAP